MYILPFTTKSLTTKLRPSEIETVLTNLVRKPTWKLKRKDIAENYVFEGKIDSYRFVIVHGRYGLTFGKTSLLPRLYGRFFSDNASSLTRVQLVIRPGSFGIMIYFSFLLFTVMILYQSIKMEKPTGIIVAAGIIIVTYFSLMQKFNKEVVEYKKIIMNELELIERDK